MKKRLFLSIFLSIVTFGYSQNNSTNIIVDYYHFYNNLNSSQPAPREAKLVVNDTLSVYEMFDKKAEAKLPDKYDTDKGNVLVIRTKKNRTYYKNLIDRTIVNKERIFLEKFIVKDTLDLFDWKLTQNKKIVLGYECQEAIAEFRGRKYTAYFTPEIPVQNGPWKFHGLPGLILEAFVNKNDAFEMKITAGKVEFSSESCEIINPYLGKRKFYLRENFENAYRRKYDEMTSYHGEGGVTYGMSKGIIEVIVKE